MIAKANAAVPIILNESRAAQNAHVRVSMSVMVQMKFLTTTYVAVKCARIILPLMPVDNPASVNSMPNLV